uniref:Uncharacterized protein n=1 Tax=Tetranychus urticae TaxID=32264 RepID=T1L313_TETUR
MESGQSGSPVHSSTFQSFYLSSSSWLIYSPTESQNSFTH